MNQTRCSICLDQIIDQTLIVPCQHSEYCFRCMRIWTTNSNRCPICVQPIDHLVHRIDPLTKDFQTFHPLPVMPSLDEDSTTPTQLGEASRHAEHLAGLERRRFIYQHSLYVKHIPSNRYTNFRPISAKHFLQEQSKDPSQSTRKDSPSAQLINRTTRFLQRELRALQPSLVLPHSIDHSIRIIFLILHRVDSNSPQAVRLFSELIREPHLAQHFSHELTCFLRSPYTDLLEWDQILQYPTKAELSSNSN